MICTTRSHPHAKQRTYAASPAFGDAAYVSVGAVCCVGTSHSKCECGKVLADFGCECTFLSKLKQQSRRRPIGPYSVDDYSPPRRRRASAGRSKEAPSRYVIRCSWRWRSSSGKARNKTICQRWLNFGLNRHLVLYLYCS